jgi:glycosyltransferase involved in cell wall biosynthesis
MKILLCGHACGPDLGSEPGFTWNWAWHLSERHRVWALVHPEHRPEIEAFLREHPNENLNFLWVSLPRWLDPWNPLAGERGLGLHYLMWQRAALREARRRLLEIKFDICHYVSWGTISVAPLLWKLPVPFFWGPVGGGQTAPLALRQYLGNTWPREAIRNVRIRLRRVAPSLRRIVRSSALILAANSETRTLLERAGAKNICLFPDSALPQALFIENLPDRVSRDEVVLHWSGRLESRKALPMALEALAGALNGGRLNIRLEVSGDGPGRKYCKTLAAKLAISDRVRFLGCLPRTEVLECFRRADAFIFTSLRDSFGSVCLEAMAQGLPIVLLDHQGVRDFVPSEASWKVPPTTPSETVGGLAAAIRQVATDRESRIARGKAALEFAKLQSWPLRVKRMECLYDEYRRPHC